MNTTEAQEVGREIIHICRLALEDCSPERDPLEVDKGPLLEQILARLRDDYGDDLISIARTFGRAAGGPAPEPGGGR